MYERCVVAFAKHHNRLIDACSCYLSGAFSRRLLCLRQMPTTFLIEILIISGFDMLVSFLSERIIRGAALDRPNHKSDVQVLLNVPDEAPLVTQFSIYAKDVWCSRPLDRPLEVDCSALSERREDSLSRHMIPAKLCLQKPSVSALICCLIAWSTCSRHRFAAAIGSNRWVGFELQRANNSSIGSCLIPTIGPINLFGPFKILP